MGVLVTAEQTLAGQQSSLSKETKWLRRLTTFEIALACGFLIAGLAVRAVGGGWLPLIIGGVLAFLAAAHLYKQRENVRQQRIIAAGQQGEARITRLLERDLAPDCYVLNDITIPFARRSAQIDHLVISPQGVFLFETKNWGGALSGDAQAEKWTQIRSRDGKRVQLSNPIRQVARQANFMQQFLKAHGFDAVPVYPAVVFSNSRTTWDAHSGEAPLLRPDEIPEFVYATPTAPDFGFERVRELVRALSGKELL